jgi:hypothetical protein
LSAKKAIHGLFLLGGRRIRRRLVEWQYAIHGLFHEGGGRKRQGFSGAAGVASGDASSNGKKRFLALYHQKLLRGVARDPRAGVADKRSPEGESAGGSE